MNTYPALTISLLSQLTDRQLQSNYLNCLDLTPEIASLLTQITDRDLALKIVNLALEVDLFLGASLTRSIDPELQKVIVDAIESLEIPTRLKISLWHQTKSKAALPYLQNIFIFKHQQTDEFYGQETIESAISTIIKIDRDLAISLLIEALYDTRFYSKAAKLLTELAPVEAIEALGDLLWSQDRISYRSHYHAIEALDKIGTEAATTKIRDALNYFKCHWSDTNWIHGLGIIAEPATIEHLLYLLYEPGTSDEICIDAIEALERISEENVNVFDWLHQAMYWVSNDDGFCSPFSKIVETLFRIDTDRMLIALECAIQSYDPKVRKRVALSLFGWDIISSDRNLSILLSAIDDPDLEVQLEIVNSIRQIACNYDLPDITPELRDRAIFDTKQILLEHIDHPNLEIRSRVNLRLLVSEPDERELIIKSLDDVNSANLHKVTECFANEIIKPDDLPILLEYLNDDSTGVRACVAGIIGKVGDNSIIPILLELIHDPERDICAAAIKSLIDLGSAAIFPTILELASNLDLVQNLIWELAISHKSEARSKIFDEFQSNLDLTLKFIEIAERSLIESINNDLSDGLDLVHKIYGLGEIGSDLSISTLLQLIETGYPTHYEIDQDCVVALTKIGTDRARTALLEFLPDNTTLGGAIWRELLYYGKLGIVPQIWSFYRQSYSPHLYDRISRIQEKEGLYNPDFSDRSHPLFEPPRLRLRHIILGDCKYNNPI
jgi:hypothetical protein